MGEEGFLGLGGRTVPCPWGKIKVSDSGESPAQLKHIQCWHC